VLTGSGAFFGALFVLSALIVDDAERRLLHERSGLAQMAGTFLESRLLEAADHLVGAATPLLDPTSAGDPTALRAAAAHVFTEGAVVVDQDGRARAATSGSPAAFAARLDLAPLLARVVERQAPVVAPRERLDGLPALVLAAPVSGPNPGYVIGVLRAGDGDLLAPLRHRSSAARPKATTLTLVDDQGRVVASTDDRRPLDAADHKGFLTRSISARRPFQGRCHSCHEGAATDAPLREVEVLAFAPLPTLDLGLGVLEPESAALAPARALRSHLWQMGAALVVLFMVFTALAVRSVVRPIRRLTWAVAAAEREHGALPAAQFGRDEIGALATAMESWRRRMLESLAAAEESREALRIEGVIVDRHVAALREISALSLRGPPLEALVEASLARSLESMSLAAGALRVVWHGRETRAVRGLDPEVAAVWLDRAEAPDAPAEPLLRLLTAPVPGVSAARVASVAPIEDLRITLVVVEPETRGDEDPTTAGLWLGALFRQICLCTSQVLVHEADAERQQTQRSVLERVLGAQEAERGRVARDLHDTVAQDLAALRLELERLAGRTAEPDARETLAALETRATEMLATVRAILLDLRLSILETLGLVPALRWLLERTTRERGVPTHFMLDGDESPPVPYETGVMLFRILQEGLLNAVQHAAPDHIFVTLRLSPWEIELLVEDDGQGFDPAILSHPHPAGPSRGLGLHGIAERARILGGTSTLTSTPGEGATLCVRLPRPRSDAP
jgi:signal transduction histidine kinase